MTAFIAGPYEFISDDGVEHALPEAYAPLVKAYEALNYSAGAISPAEATQFSSMGIAPPRGWQVLDSKEPKAVILDTAKGKVGVVYFPEIKKAGGDPTPEQLQAISRKLKELRPQVKLLVGVSPWGVQTESDFIEKQKPDLDVLLGSGTGVGFSAKADQGNGRVLWMHTYTKGKAIYTIDLLAWPSEKSFKWEKEVNFTTQAVVLDDTFNPTPALEQMLQNVPDPGDKQAK
ncbi:MAG: hypothetical protein FD177_2606 [Desulfovibrionaceae bacterium]|nr:MAG: hypothetical protein FD177_2606 [Desulfovibrionaceae bacterium]